MHVYVYVCVCVCILHTHTHTHTCICTHTNTHTHKYTVSLSARPSLSFHKACMLSPFHMDVWRNVSNSARNYASSIMQDTRMACIEMFSRIGVHVSWLHQKLPCQQNSAETVVRHLVHTHMIAHIISFARCGRDGRLRARDTYVATNREKTIPKRRHI
jgi:hypothetical protein